MIPTIARISSEDQPRLPNMVRCFGKFIRGRTAKMEPVPSLEPDLRIYAIGDIHGRSDLLEAVLAKLEEHVSAHPIETVKFIFLGDYVDRGPNTRSVLEILSEKKTDNRFVFIRGNHEAFMLSAMESQSVLAQWLWAGGRETLQSYGINVPMRVGPDELKTVLATIKSIIPDHHLAFLTELETKYASGSYAFVHAGFRPGVTFDRQAPRDLMSIREDFLKFSGSHGHVVVHGHTPVEEPDIRLNRINIDTGAYITGNLTCLILEGSDIAFL